MAKRLFLLIFFAIIASITLPGTLVCSDSFLVSSPEFNSVETVEIVKEEPKVDTGVSIASNYPKPIPHVVQTRAASPVFNNSITFLGRTIEVVDVADTAIDAGNHVNRYGGVFLYGHNTANVFGALSGLGVGSDFVINNSGVGRHYRVANVMLFEKVSDYNLGLGGQEYPMSYVAYGMGQYDMVLMTCAGVMYGGGDASHRLVVFANAM